MEIVVAHSLRRRLLGLALRQRPPPARALLIPRCSSVHTFGMRCALDLVWLDRFGRVVHVELGVPPRRVRRRRGAAAVIEAVAGNGPCAAALWRDRAADAFGTMAPMAEPQRNRLAMALDP